MSALWFAIAATLGTAAALLHVNALYIGGLTLLALARSQLGRSAGSEREPTHAPPRIAAVVVAHNEEAVIARAVASLRAQEHDSTLFDVFVVADNCTDATAERAREHGARVVERAGTREGGKNAAVEAGLTHVEATGSFDAIAVFDADNIAHPRFLSCVSRRLASGTAVVQGYVDAKNPSATWVSASSAIGFWSLAATQQWPREQLGLSAPLMGTGYAMSLAAARVCLTNVGSLTDDLEAGARLALRGMRVAFEPEARAFDEKPTRLKHAVGQRHRWMQGRWAVLGRYGMRLLRYATSSASTAKRLRALDVAWQLGTPSLLFSAVALAVVSLTGMAATMIAPDRARSALLVWQPHWTLAAAAAYYAIPLPAIATRRPAPRVWLCYALQPAYLLLSIPLALTGFVRRSGRLWNRTPHAG